MDSNQEIEKTFQDYIAAVKTLQAESVINFWTDDLKIVSKEGDLDGKPAFRNFLINHYDGLVLHNFNAETLKIDASDNLGVQLSLYSETISSNGGEPITIAGKQITIWKKIGDMWKINLVTFIPTSDNSFNDI